MTKSIHTRRYRELIRLLVEARNASGMTQQALARKLGRPQSFVAKIETRERRLDVVEFLIVARHLRADPQAILRKVSAVRG